MRIVIGVDRSPEAEQACRFVADRTWPTGTRAILVGAYAPRVEWASYAAVGVDDADEDRRDLEALLDQRADILRHGVLAIEREVGIGPAAEVLMNAAAGHVADLIVVGSRRRGPLSSAILGSVSAHLVDHAPCPVLVVRGSAVARMLVATDGTLSSQAIPRVLHAWGPALRGCRVGGVSGARPRVLHAWDPAFRGFPVEVVSVAPRHGFVTPWATDETEDEPAVEDLAVYHDIAEHVANELMELGWHAAAVARVGQPNREIVAAGEEWGADLIVTGSRGIGTLHRLLAGSVAHDVLLHTRSSVLVVRGTVAARIPVARVAAQLAPG